MLHERSWAMEEFGGANMGDARLSKRLIKQADRLGDARPARCVRQTLHARSVDLPDGHGGLMPVTCLVARETGAPQGQKAIEWRLLTNRAVATLNAA
ncbi:MAG: hypothetical protein LCH90_22335 [Proteobacteria bacterium]|nr:hypothetical protein [Pseudomonadota bacterium]